MPSSEARRRFGDFTRGVPRCSDERIYRSRNRPMKRGRRQEPRTHHQINAWHIKLRILAFPAAVLLRSAIPEAKQQNPPSIHPVDGMVGAAVTARREQRSVSRKSHLRPTAGRSHGRMKANIFPSVRTFFTQEARARGELSTICSGGASPATPCRTPNRPSLRRYRKWAGRTGGPLD